MEKMFFTIVVAATMLTSCVVESYEKPKRTIVGYNLSEHVSFDIRTASSIADVARIVDLWRSATTEQEKFDIEDKYFGDNIKLREYEDSVKVVGYYEIKTFGKPLLESKWQVTSLRTKTESCFMYEVSLVGVNEYLINTFNARNELLGELTLKAITPDKVYSVLGNSTIVSNFTTTRYDKIAYTIITPVEFVFNESKQFFWQWHMFLRQQDGSVGIKVYKSGVELEQDRTLAEYIPQGVEVLYRSFKESHTYPGWWYE